MSTAFLLGLAAGAAAGTIGTYFYMSGRAKHPQPPVTVNYHVDPDDIDGAPQRAAQHAQHRPSAHDSTVDTPPRIHSNPLNYRFQEN